MVEESGEASKKKRTVHLLPIRRGKGYLGEFAITWAAGESPGVRGRRKR